jgi:hypothetical protein
MRILKYLKWKVASLSTTVKEKTYTFGSLKTWRDAYVFLGLGCITVSMISSKIVLFLLGFGLLVLSVVLDMYIEYRSGSWEAKEVKT